MCYYWTFILLSFLSSHRAHSPVSDVTLHFPSFVWGKSHHFSALIPQHTPQVIVVLRCYRLHLSLCLCSKRACMFFFLFSPIVCVFMCQQPRHCTPKLVCGSSELWKKAFLSSWKMWWNGAFQCVFEPDPAKRRGTRQSMRSYCA